MKKKLFNILKYLSFTGLGVLLFYLATLDVTRGTATMAGRTISFKVGSGLEACEGGRLIELRVVSDQTLDAMRYQIEDEQGGGVAGQASFEQKEQVYFAPICLPSGKYKLTLDSDLADTEIIVKGVNSFDELVEDMSQASWTGIIASFLMGYLAIVFRGVRWLILLEPLGYKPKKWHSIHSVAFAYFANTFVPRSGEIARCGALNQTDNIPVDKLFGTVISERVVDFVMLFTFMSVAVISNLDAFYNMLEGTMPKEDGGGSSTLIYGLIGGLLLFTAILLLLRKKIVSSILYKKVLSFVKGVGEGLLSVLKMRRKGMFITYTILIWMMYFLMTYVIFMSIEATEHMTVFQALFVMVAGGFGIVLPSPGGIGSYHWLVKLSFAALGMSATLGFAVANVVWLTQTLAMVLGGGIGYVALMVYKLQRDRIKQAQKS